MALTQIDDRGLKTPIDLLDNEKIRLGTGNDLELYHDGSNSLIRDTGTGYLKIDSNGSGIYLNKSDGESMASFITDGAVDLFYNGSKKFETTNTGATVTGTAIATGLTINGATTPATINHTGGNALHLTRSSKTLAFNANYGASDTHATIDVSSGMALRFQVNSNDKITFDSSGNLIIGATSYQNGGFGGTSHGINIAGTQPQILLHETDTDKDAYFGLASSILRIQTADSIPFTIWNNDTERMRIDSSGRLLLGSTTEGHGDADEFTISNTSGANMGMTIRSGTGALGNIFFSDGTSGGSEYRGMIQYGHNNDSLRFGTAETERMRIDSSGNIKIGESNSGAVAFSLVTNGTGMLLSRATSGNPDSGQTLGDIGFNAYSNTQTTSSADALIRGQAAYSFSGSSAPTDILFFTKPTTTGPGSSPTERIRILHSGGITFNGDTAAANALNDYEEGTYSPALGANGNVSGGNGLGCSYTTQTGYYIRIGDFVFCNGLLAWNNKSGTLSNTSVNLTLSIPFAMGGSNNQGAGQLSYNDAIDFNADCNSVHGVGANSYIYFNRVATGSGKHLGYVQTQNLASSGQINFGFSYRIL